MLTEYLIASLGVPTKAPGTHVVKDAAIFLHEFQPLSQQRAVYKKSATARNCLAVSDNHIFAAQIDKAVVHVYNRNKGNQEATVPFPERISSITLACDDSVLIIGTVEGRIYLWETSTGRQTTTGQLHLQAITSLVVDQTSNFLLSASADSTVLVWSIPALLSFSSTTNVPQLRTFNAHHSAIIALAVGHSASHCNIAVSASKDKTCLVWDYHSGNLLRTYLLPGVPTSLALDPADRAIYIGFEDGSLQQLDLYTAPSGALDAVQNGADATTPVMPPKTTQWKLQDSSHGAVMSLSLSFGGTILASGHQSGSILTWDTARRMFLSALVQPPLPGPVNNLFFLPVAGFETEGKRLSSKTEIVEVVKPKFGAFDSAESGTVPGSYTVKAHFTSALDDQDYDGTDADFVKALTAPVFPTALLDQGLDELASWGNAPLQQLNVSAEDGSDDFMALDETPRSNGQLTPQEENVRLKRQVEGLRKVQLKTFEKMDKLNKERNALLQQEQKRRAIKAGGKSNGHRNDNGSESASDSDTDMR